VGKSTLFKALTKKPINISNYPFCTILPNVGIVQVPDERLDQLSQKFNPLKTIPAIVEFVDIAGLVKGASQGEGLGNQFLSQIREVDAIIHLVRGFLDPEIIHVAGNIDPLGDRDVVELELKLKDEASKEKVNLLSEKPILYVLNCSSEEPELYGDFIKKYPPVIINLKEENPDLSKLITASYELLNLITFFTAGPDEVRAWTIKKGALAPAAAGKIHSDFQNKFICAEVINWQDLLNNGLWRTKGKDYLVQDGDVMIFKHGQ